MVIHAIVDYSFLYYKYKFQLDSGKMRRLTTAMEWNGVVIEKDISQIYYSIKEIEGFRRKLEATGHTVFVSVCFDSKTVRKEVGADDSDSLNDAATKYKSNRVKRLHDEDFQNIDFVAKLLAKAGYNTYKINGMEADDIVASLLEHYSEAFDYNIIYTPDADLIVHVSNRVGVSRYKVSKGYSNVDMSTYEEYLSAEYKCNMPYNALMLFKSTVGDKSDCIDGIKKFGPKAFDKLVNHLDSLGIQWEKMNDWREVEKVIMSLSESGYFNSDQTTQALNSLHLVRPMIIECENLAEPIKHSNRELREQAYKPYNMVSLID